MILTLMKVEIMFLYVTAKEQGITAPSFSVAVCVTMIHMVTGRSM